MTLNTPITQLLKIRVPVVSAPMAGVAGGELAAKVTLAGGFGFTSPAYNGIEKFEQQLKIARNLLKTSPSDILPIGIGFLGWKLDEPNSDTPKLLDFALENRPRAIWFSFGTDQGRWIKYVREADQKHDRPRKTLIFAQVNTKREAFIAINEWKVDVVVAQGVEAGGHGSWKAPSTPDLVKEVLEAVGDKPLPILAAGGLAGGKDVAAMVKLGASGAVLGTRFVLTPEAMYSEAKKNALLAAGDSSTVRSMAFDHAANTLGWPEGIDGRGLNNELVRAYDQGGVEVVKTEFEVGLSNQDIERAVVWAGTGVASMNTILNAEDVVREIEQALFLE